MSCSCCHDDHINKCEASNRKNILNLSLMIVSIIIAFILEGVEIYYAFAGSNQTMPIWMDWASFGLSTIVVGLYGWKFVYWSYEEIFKEKMTGMYTMISLCIIVSYAFSFYPLIENTINYAHNIQEHGMMSFFPTAAVVAATINLGNYLTTKLEHKAEDDITAIATLKVNDANLFNPKTKKNKIVNIDTLQINDLIQVNKGESIPVDCVVYKGLTYIDESSITGESKPQKKTYNSNLISGTINVGNTIIAKVIRTSKDSTLNQILENVKRIQEEKPKYQKIADRLSKWFVPIIIVLAITTFCIQAFVPGIEDVSSAWLFGNERPSNNYVAAIYYAVAVLAVSCPCALGVAIPFASLSGISKASKNGIIINHASAYEKVNKIDLIAFDKTGTLTKGKFEVKSIIGNTKYAELIYHMESKSIHPLAKSYTDWYISKHKNIKNRDIKVSELSGVGLLYKENNKTTYKLVSYKFIKDNITKLKLNKDVEKYVNRFETSQENYLTSLAFLIKNDVVESVIVFKDCINENTLETINVLKSRGIDIYMITGDNEKSAKKLATQLGIKYYANVLPNQKAEIVKQFQSEGHCVCYVGDGINDLEVLKQANLSMAINKDNAIVNNVADISILNKDIMSVIKTIFITKLIRRVIFLNLFWAFFYNTITIPLTMLGYLPAFLAVIAMACSDAFVIINSIFFKSKKFRYVSRKEARLIDKAKYDLTI